MTISIFGILLLLFCLGYFVYSFGLQRKPIDKVFNSFFLISIITGLVFDVGFILQIGESFTFEYNYLFSIILFVLAIFILMKKKLSASFFVPFIIFAFYLVLITVIPILNHTTYLSAEKDLVWDVYFGVDGEKYTPVSNGIGSFFIIVRVLMFLISFYTLSLTLTKEDFKSWVKITYYVSWVVIVLSVIETLVNNLASPTAFRSLCFDFFGKSESTYEVPKSIRRFYTPMLFMREPSSYSLSLFIFAINNILYLYRYSYRNTLRIILNILLIVLFSVASFSMSSLIYLLVLFFISIYIVGVNRGWFAILVAIIAIPVGIVLFKDRVMNTLDIFSTFHYALPKDLPAVSEIIRFYSIYNNFTFFLKYPLFGTGVGAIYSFSSTVTLLSNIGIVGVLMFIYLIYVLTNNIFKTKSFSMFTVVVVILSFTLTGHMSLILYIDKIILLYLVCKSIHLQKEGQRFARFQREEVAHAI